MIEFWGFDIILDDIVLSDGTTHMGVLGGGGPQAAFGMRLWSDSVGLIASVGPDMPEGLLKWFDSAEITTAISHDTQAKTPRAWQILETDGRRIQIWRTPKADLNVHLKHQLDRIPVYQYPPKGFHFGVNPMLLEDTFIAGLNELGALVSIETFQNADRILSPGEVGALVSAADIFSLNLNEAHSMLGENEPVDLISTLLNAGAPVAILRMGHDGALVGAADQPDLIHMHAVPTENINPIGAGNAFCGGFLVAYAKGYDLFQSAARAAVSASFMIEQIGLPDLTLVKAEKIKHRLEQALSTKTLLKKSKGVY